EFPRALSSLDQNPEVSVIVLSGRGKHFCTGIDLTALNSIFSSYDDVPSERGRSGEKQLHNLIFSSQARAYRHFLVILENLYPMDDEPMWVVDRVVSPTPGSAITILETANEFAIKVNHLTLVKGNQFDGRTKTDPHKHIQDFLEICDMFKYRDTENEAVRLMMFPLSLTGEAKTWMD
ncbi:reverse transcriptase domain-containing protein, partial [Tanacetum coccineum]